MWGKISALGAKVTGGGTNESQGNGGLTGDALNDALDVAVNADAVLDLFSQAATSADRATVLSSALERLMVAHTRVAERHVQQLLLAVSSAQGGGNKDEIYQATNVLLACVQSEPNKEIIQRQTSTWLEGQEDVLIQREAQFSSSPAGKIYKNKNKTKDACEEDGEVFENTSVQELIVASLPDDADCLLSLITADSSHGFWVRYTVTQLLKELVSTDHLYPGDPFLNLLMRSTCGVGSMVELLDDMSNDGILRAEGISLLLAFATKVYSTVEYESHVQDLFTFENLFDRLFLIIKEGGGSGSQDTAAVAMTNDCAQIVAWLVTVSTADAAASSLENLDDAEGGAGGAAAGAGVTPDAAKSNEKVISFFIKMEHVKALVPCLQQPGTELGNETVLHGLRTLDSVLRVALQPAVAAPSGGKRPRTPKGLVDPHTFRPSMVSSKVFPSLCALLPLHTMLTRAASTENASSSGQQQGQEPSVVLLKRLVRDRRLAIGGGGGEEAAASTGEEALCLLIRCLLLITEECPSGREHLLHPSSPVFPMLTVMSTSGVTAENPDFKKSNFLALSLLLQLLGYMDSTRGSAPQTMLDMVVRCVIDILNALLPESTQGGGEERVLCLAPPLLAHRLSHVLLRLASALHSHQEEAEQRGFTFLARIMQHCTARLDGEGGSSLGASLPSPSYLCYYLEPLMLSVNTYSHCFSSAAATNDKIIPLTLAESTPSTHMVFSLAPCVKTLLQLHAKVQQAPSAGGDSSSMQDASLLLGGICGFLLVAASAGAQASQRDGGGTAAIDLAGGADVVAGMEGAIFNTKKNDDWYTTPFYQSYHRSCVDTSASSLTTTTTTATTVVGSTAGFGGTRMGEFIFSVAFNWVGTAPERWATPRASEGPTLSGARGNASRTDCGLDGSVKDLLKSLCESTFSVYFSKRRAQVLQQGLGDTQKRARATSMMLAQQQLDNATSASETIAEYQSALHEAERENASLEDEVERLRGIIDTQVGQISQLTEEHDVLCSALHDATCKQSVITRALIGE